MYNTHVLKPTWNISPAPSQSDADRMGVCMYWNPDSRKNWWVAKARALRTRVTAPNVFVRGLRWGMLRRYGRECLFFCRG